MMAASNAGTSIGYNKENSESEKDEGIEAQDLATLLSRFEEATSSDDLYLPQAVHKAKWNIMKAKSAGNSPAVTPPATPPPTQSNRFGPVRLNTFTKTPPTVINNQIRPVQMTLVKPTVVSPQISTLSATTSRVGGFTKISTTSVVPPKPKIHIQLSSNNSVLSSSAITLTSPQHAPKSVNSSPQILSLGVSKTPVGIVKKVSSVSLATSTEISQQKRVIHIPIRSNKNKTTVQATLNRLQSTSVQTTLNQPQATTVKVEDSDSKVNVIRLPALDAASSLNFPSSVVKQIIPKKRVSTLPSATDAGKKIKLESAHSSSLITTTASLLPPKLSSSLLAAHLASPVIPSKHGLPSLLNLKTESHTPLPIPGSSNGCSNQSAGGRNLNLPNSIAQTVTPKVPQAQSDMKIQRDEHTYAWSGPCFNNKTSQRIGLSSSVLDVAAPSSELALDDVESGLVEEEVVLEEGEVYVDANGNDIFSKDPPNAVKSEAFNEEQSNRVVCFDTGDKNVRRGRKYRRRGLGDSPVREDTSDFFDKIPSYYTALSIPAKQIRKSVFESVSNTVGSQDHLAMPAQIEEPEDEGQYNKVPMHHRIFTNTSEDLDLPAGMEPESRSNNETAREDVPSRGRSSRVRRVSTASRHSGHSTSSHRSRRSGSRYSYDGRSSRSRSRSPGHSPVDRERGRPISRRRRNSSSQFSTSSYSSSCSSGSYCSTCGASLSRSRSRSYSSDGSRGRSYSPQSVSRSRSRSPHGNFRRRRRSGRSPSTDHFRSRSRSRSPFRRRRNSFRTSSRSRRHQMKERSSAERRIMENRKQREEDKVKAMEERRVIYVGKIPDNYTKHQLRKRFESFGEILTVRLNFRVHGDNYGFVTFAYACDAFAAKEKGNNLPGLPRFDLCFGGRRRFCPDKYADLDGNREIEEEYAPMPSSSTGELDYAALLKQHVSQQKKNKR